MAHNNLEIHKKNGRSLFGLIMSLEKQKKKSASVSENSEESNIDSNGSMAETSKTEFCINPEGVIQKLCEEFKEALKNATEEPSLKTM
jgi:hypothetical protein